MNYIKINFYILLFCFAYPVTLTAKNTDTANLSFYLKKYNIDKINPLLIVAVNIGECQPYKIGLEAIRKKIESQKIENNVLYLFNGLRQSEVDFYMKNELKISPDIKAISDEDFFSTVSPSLFSLVMILSNDGNSRWYHVYDAAKYIEIEKVGINYGIIMTDSVTLDEKTVPISSTANIHFIDDKIILITDPTYNTISTYDLKTGKRKNTLTPKYDYSKLYEKYLSNENNSKKDFAESMRHYIKEFEQKEFKIYNVFVSGYKIYISTAIMYHTRKATDTTLADFPFLLITDTSFTKQTYIHIPTHSDSCYILLRNPFYVLNDSTMIFTIGRAKAIQNSEDRFLARFTYSEKKSTLSWKKFLNIKLPLLFVEHGRYNNFDFNRFFMFKNELYCYFNNILPCAYGTNNTSITCYPNKFYANNNAANYFLRPSPFSIEAVNSSSLGNLDFITSENGIFFYSVLNVENNTMEYKINFPVYKGKTRFAFGDHNLFLLHITPDRVFIDKYKLSSL